MQIPSFPSDPRASKLNRRMTKYIDDTELTVMVLVQWITLNEHSPLWS